MTANKEVQEIQNWATTGDIANISRKINRLMRFFPWSNLRHQFADFSQSAPYYDSSNDTMHTVVRATSNNRKLRLVNYC